MAREHVLATSQAPNVEVVDLLDCLELLNLVEQLNRVHIVRSGLHDYLGALNENGNSGQQNKDREEVSADGIGYLPFWIHLNDDSGRDYSDGLHHISSNVDYSCPGAHVVVCLLSLLFLSIVVLLDQFFTLRKRTVILNVFKIYLDFSQSKLFPLLLGILVLNALFWRVNRHERLG